MKLKQLAAVTMGVMVLFAVPAYANDADAVVVSDGTLWEVLTALYFRWTCLPDCAVPELDADYRRNNRRLS